MPKRKFCKYRGGAPVVGPKNQPPTMTQQNEKLRNDMENDANEIMESNAVGGYRKTKKKEKKRNNKAKRKTKKKEEEKK